MKAQEALTILQAMISCNTLWVSGQAKLCNRNCEECHLNYEKGTMKEQRELFEIAKSAIEKRKPVTPERVTEVTVTCPLCHGVTLGILRIQNLIYCRHCGQALSISIGEDLQ